MQTQRLQFQGASGNKLIADARGNPDAPPVLLLHGGGQTRHAWGGTAQSLAEAGRYALSLDLRGHGESAWVDEPAAYSLALFAADVERVVAEFKTPPALVGASLGGLTSLLLVGEVALKCADAVVFVDVAPRIEQKGADRITSFMLAKPEGYASLEEVAEAIEGYTKNRSRKRNLESLRKNLRETPDGRFHWHWDPRFVGGQGPTELTDRDRLYRAARSIEAPSLVVRGRESDLLSPEGAQELLDLLQKGEFVDVSGAGHMVAGDRNDAFTLAVSDFLDRVMPLP
jgi:pimeloyl-ACP methyl ester carboxylesterase